MHDMNDSIVAWNDFDDFDDVFDDFGQSDEFDYSDEGGCYASDGYFETTCGE